MLNDPNFIKIFVYFLFSNTDMWDDSFCKEDYTFFLGILGIFWGDILLFLHNFLFTLLIMCVYHIYKASYP